MIEQDIRFQDLDKWLYKVVDEPRVKLDLASADASFRRYFRLQTSVASYIVMDAPPSKEPIDSFVHCAAALKSQNVHVPSIFSVNSEDGFILMEDLGSNPYLVSLKKSPDQLYLDAITALQRIQAGVLEQPELDLPAYNATSLDKELNVFEDWYLRRHLDFQMSESQQSIWHDLKSFLIESCIEQPQVWVHRDYHSRNLMITEDQNPGVIDFQDMVVGPLAYDLASLFKDCYIEWPRERQLLWCNQFLQQSQQFSGIPQEQLTRWYDLTGLQRHLKVLGVFCRLHYRDGKSHYLADLALVNKYVREVLSLYPELTVFEKFFNGLAHDKNSLAGD